MSVSWNPGGLISISSAYWRGCTLQAAVRLEIFTVLGREWRSGETVSRAIGGDSRATGFLLNALCSMQMLEKSGENYRNAEQIYELLCKDSPQYIGHIILHHHHLLDGWAQLDTAVLSGKPVATRSYGEAVERESFLMGMFNLASSTAPLIAGVLNLQGKNRMLDLGGGPGTYAIHFCRSNPDLSAVVFDRPTTEAFMHQTVASFDLSDRIDFYPGDFLTDTIGGGPYDVAWLSHVLHSNGPEECQQLVDKTFDALAPGGIILVHDFILADTKDRPEFGALFSLNMLLNNPRGRSYSAAEIETMLESAGFTEMDLIDPKTPNESQILRAVKP
jgi:predicted O-methyltransferase YrrM